MKQCPACHTTYADDLSFCLNDGASLVPSIVPMGGEETIISSPRGGDRRAIHVSTGPTESGGQPTLAFSAPPPPTSGPVAKKGGSNFITVAIVILFLLLVGGGGAIIVVSMLMNSVGNSNNTRVATETPTPTATATPATTPTPSPSPKKSATPKEDDGTEELRDALADLQKMMEKELKNANSKSGGDSDTSTDGLGTMAFANSPEDGFLALRSQPSSDVGTRVATIPHGAKMTINKCGKVVTTKLGNRGRWCTAGYAGKIGWVFDKYVRY